MLSLSKYERTLRVVNGLSSPYPSTSFLRQAQDGAGRTDWKGALQTPGGRNSPEVFRRSWNSGRKKFP
ncbi:MAG: hypothetical protein LBD67_02080 [Candidatus Accumulibacter sp.]|nr:hypothetical protein [Accumulibacter sp.]